MDAADGAVGRAPLRRDELAADVVDRVGLERDARRAALLRAVVDEALFADVEVPRARHSFGWPSTSFSWKFVMPEYRFLNTCHGPLIAADTSS